MGVVNRKWVRVESTGVARGCGCKEVYRFPHNTYPYSSLQQHPTFLFIFKMFFFLVPVRFCFSRSINTHIQATTGVPRKPYEVLHLMFYTRHQLYVGMRLLCSFLAHYAIP